MNNLEFFENYDIDILRPIFSRIDKRIIESFEKEISILKEAYGDRLMVSTSFTLDEDRQIPVTVSSDYSDGGPYLHTLIGYSSLSNTVYNRMCEFSKPTIDCVWDIIKRMKAIIFFTIRFNDIVVENEEGETTDIAEAFFILPMRTYFSNNNHEICAPKMTRSKYTIEHFANGYMHSHAETVAPQNAKSIHKLCLGNGPISAMIMNFNVNYNNIKDQDEKDEYIEDFMKMMIFNIDRYVTVESLKGGPYIRMSSARSVDNIIGRGGRIVKIQRRREIMYDLPNRNHVSIFSLTYNNMTLLIDYFIRRIYMEDVLKPKSEFKKNEITNISFHVSSLNPVINEKEMIIKLSDILYKTIMEYCMKTDSNIDDIVKSLASFGFLDSYIIDSNGDIYVKKGKDNNAREIEKINNSIDNLSESPLLTFNGERIFFSCNKITEKEKTNTKYMINDNVMMFILKTIFNIR